MQQKMNNDGGSVHFAECVMYDNKYSIPFLDIYFLLGPYYPSASECIVRSIKNILGYFGVKYKTKKQLKLRVPLYFREEMQIFKLS